MAIITMKLNNDLTYEALSKTFSNGIDRLLVLRYLKGIYTNKERFKSRFISLYKTGQFINELFDFFLDNFDKVNTFSYNEAFGIKNLRFQILVFSSIDIDEMISNLGSKRLKVEGKEVERKIYSKSGDFLGIESYHNVYETYEVKGDRLNLQENIYALKVWCTSTDKEHWLWIDEKYKDIPLEAVASTFHIHENLIPHIKELKRQGDILLVEMDKDIKPEGEVVPLTAEQYFGLLTSET